MEEPLGKYGKLQAQILAVGLLSCLTSDQLCLFTYSVSEQPLQALWRLPLYQSGGFTRQKARRQKLRSQE